jgi:putative two-component system response regulator
MAKLIALGHHEKWNGGGYPYGRWNGYSIVAHIVAIADVFDALTCVRPMRGRWKGAGIDRKGAGEHFDPNLVNCFWKRKRKCGGSRLNTRRYPAIGKNNGIPA